jgi:hypothetical protein
MDFANIGPRERRKRLVFGVAMLIVGFGGLLVLIAFEAPLTWRAALFAPFWLAALGYYQARERT